MSWSEWKLFRSVDSMSQMFCEACSWNTDTAASDHACHCQGGPLHTLQAASLNHVRMRSNIASGQMAALTHIYKMTAIIHRPRTKQPKGKKKQSRLAPLRPQHSIRHCLRLRIHIQHTWTANLICIMRSRQPLTCLVCLTFSNIGLMFMWNCIYWNGSKRITS